ncbi:hypothetical protein [uncultured Senegalimassilia sp.]|mgnify:CR=1 FL=1|uniref:hypothetical protein n=1 Tax=uncultured Senegalimassilia sp. TaxID=1714350 RepID=UPI0027DB3983|nr:hypothetical protein [uncultured Senegalimassilia sp.]
MNGAERRTGAKIACVGVSALIAGQLFMPAASLAAETADKDTATNDAAAVAALAAQASPAAETAPAASAAPAAGAPAASAPASNSASADQQAQPAPAASTNDSADNAAAPVNAAVGQNGNADNAAAPANDAIQTRGVTDVVGGEGGVKINTIVVDHYTDCVVPGNITLVKGQSYTFDFPDVEGGIPETPLSGIVETKYYRADAASGALVEVLDASMSDVTAHFEPVGDHMRLTLTFTGGAASGAYQLTRNDDLLVASTLTYTGTDYEGDNIIVGDPDDIFNAYKPGGSVVINETRDNYYLRYNINSEITLVSAEKKALENLNVDNVKTDYAPGEAPRATATIPAVDADKYEIAYECWEEMDGSDPRELTPAAFWYSDPGKYAPGMKKITQFEEGKFYMYSVELRLKDGNTLADDYKVNVNGQWVSNTIKTVEGVFAPNAANMLCEQPIVEMQAIDLIEINGATTTFKAGDKPVFTAGTPEGSNAIFQCEYWTGSDGSEVNSVEFWDQNIANHIDAFKPGVTYRYGVYLKPARGFYFAPDAKLMINGTACGYQVGEASEVDPESGMIQTLWLSTDLTFTPEGAAPGPQLQPGDNDGTTNADDTTKAPTAKAAATKPATGNLAATGDDAALMAAALGIAGATAATAVAAARRRNH